MQCVVVNWILFYKKRYWDNCGDLTGGLKTDGSDVAVQIF